MVKYICDICKSELKSEDGHGEMKIWENSFGFLKHQKVPQVREVSYLFCQRCSESMRDQKKALERSFEASAQAEKSNV